MGMNWPQTDETGSFSYGSGSNLRTGSNPAYAVSDFVTFYPQFGTNDSGVYVVPQTVIQAFIDLAQASIQQARWRNQWQFGMGLFVAHYCTLYLQTLADPNSGAQQVWDAGRARGVILSESAGGVSVSYDPNLAGRDQPDMKGWGAYHLTEFGQQLITIGRLVGKGGMYAY